jgi:small-conductance mechanosensitive channel
MPGSCLNLARGAEPSKGGARSGQLVPLPGTGLASRAAGKVDTGGLYGDLRDQIHLRSLAGAVAQKLLKAHPNEKVRFWTWQIISLVSGALLVLGVVSIWFEDPRRLTTAMGLVTAGLAFALQKVVTSFAGYLIILRGRSFTVGDRIVLGKVRGEVIALGFMQIKIMEMGQSPPEQGDAPSVWVNSRQFTGRVVTITNDRIFEDPVYNYTHEFPYLWEEMHIPITYNTDRKRAEDILLETAERHTAKIQEESRESLREMRRHYTMLSGDMKPKVYFRITDNWLELSLRFITKASGTRDLKDAMSRDILTAFDAAGIGIASATFDIVGLPKLRAEVALPGVAGGGGV